MKKFEAPVMVELNINETANGLIPGHKERGIRIDRWNIPVHNDDLADEKGEEFDDDNKDEKEVVNSLSNR